MSRPRSSTRSTRCSQYTVHEVGEGGRDRVVTGFRAINSATHPEELVEEISTANVVTTAVGPTILKFVAPHILSGLALRDPASPPLQIMACENAINATDLLRDEIKALAAETWDALAEPRGLREHRRRPDRARRSPRAPASTSPSSRSSSGRSSGRRSAMIRRGSRSAHFVDDLEPYIERKLFTVNTGHATTAYFGAAAGVEKISDALADDAIAAKVAATLEETSALLAAKHGLDPAELAEYRSTILRRFRNPLLPDTVWRVGRQPLRKLSRHERFVGPGRRSRRARPLGRRPGRRDGRRARVRRSRGRAVRGPAADAARAGCRRPSPPRSPASSRSTRSSRRWRRWSPRGSPSSPT